MNKRLQELVLRRALKLRGRRARRTGFVQGVSFRERMFTAAGLQSETPADHGNRAMFVELCCLLSEPTDPAYEKALAEQRAASEGKAREPKLKVIR
jgi:hypothetical protein